MKRTVLALLVTAGLIHCGTDNVDVKPTQPTKRPDGGVELPPAPPPLPGCDNTLMPTENACVIHESAGIFVSASKGSDGGLGTRESPLKSVSVAIGAAVTDGRRVYVCAETYEEQLKFGDGANVFGYFDCSTADWKVTDRRAKIAPKEGVAAIAKGIAKPTRIEALDIEAADGKTPGDSSIGLIAQDSNGLTFLNTRIAAGKGRDGVNGKDAVQLTASADTQGLASRSETSNAVEGNGAAYQTNRRGGVGTCAGAPGHDAGNGGDGAKSATSDCTGTMNMFGCSGATVSNPGNCFVGANVLGLPTAATATTAKGATFTTTAEAGQAGARGADGTSPPLQLGIEGIKPGNGTAATDGSPGQGGGGGASVIHSGACSFRKQWWGETGSGGGAGGCPGLAAGPGTGGGSSVAVLSKASAVKFDGRCVIAASNGGNAGRAGAFGTPSPGGNAGPASVGVNAGAKGGDGGAAGLSGHGSAGYSIGIAWSGAKPNIEVTPTVGTAGAQAMPRGNEAPGAAGLAKDVYEF